MERKLYLPNNSIVALTRWLARKINASLPKIFNYRFPITLIGIAEGGLLFTELLSSFLEMPHERGILRRGPDGSFSFPCETLPNQVILADCICDTGKTLSEISSLYKTRRTRVCSVVLLRRFAKGTACFFPEFQGYGISGNEFFVGFGLDDREGKSRELPDIYTEGEI